jgi:hypothetical protein
MGKIEKIRTWLTANEIFFKTIATIFFSASALFVSIASYLVSNQQLTMAKTVADPHFYLQILQIRNPDTEFFDDSIGIVSNNGGPADNISIDVKSFIEIRNTKRFGKSVYLPVDGYFCCQQRSQSSTGEIAKITGPKNNRNFHTLYLEALNRNHNEKDGENFVFLAEVVATTVRYQTRYQSDGTDYFLGTQKVDYQSWKDVVKSEPTPINFKLGTEDFDALLKKADQYAEFTARCKTKKESTNSYSTVCPADMKFWTP